MKYLIINKKSQLFTLAFLFLSSLGFGQGDSLKILFIGNSYTYFWNLPQTVDALLDASEDPAFVRQSTAGGATWKEHWDGEKNLKTKSILSGNWDLVVLQNHSMSTINNLENFNQYGKKLDSLVKLSSGKTLLYLTWAREFNPLMQKTITSGYEELAKNIDAEIVPVGPIWALARSLRPDIALYMPDESHPSYLGTYLTALVFYRKITGKSVTGLPIRLLDRNNNDEKLYLTIVDNRDGQFLQNAVDSYFDQQ